MRTTRFGLCVAVVCLAGALAAASASARIDSGELRRDLAVAAYGSEGGQDKVDFSVIEKIRAEGSNARRLGDLRVPDHEHRARG